MRKLTNVIIGKRALELTNEFRQQNGLPPVAWNQELCNIGMVHSKDMAHGRVAFGHHGFDKRCKAITFGYRSVCENVAYVYNVSNVPKVKSMILTFHH